VKKSRTVLFVLLVQLVFVGSSFAQVDQTERKMEEKAEKYLKESEQIFEDYHKTTKREEIEQKGAQVNKFIAGLKKLSLPLQRILVKKALWDAEKICEMTDYVETAGYLGAAQWAIISTLSEAAEPELIKGCINKNNDNEFRYHCISLLGFMKSETAVGPLIKIMRDSTDKFRGEACNNLASIGDKRAVGPMIELYWNGQMRKNVVWSLGIIGDKRAFDVLMDGLKNGDKKLKGSCIIALGGIRDRRVVPLLIEMLEKKEEEEFHIEIAIALGEIGDKRAAPILKTMLKHKDHFYRYVAAKALGEIKSKEAVNALIPLAERAELEAIKSLGKIGGDRAIEALTRLKENPPYPDDFLKKCIDNALKEAKKQR
jgi:HEAT repeat protein